MNLNLCLFYTFLFVLVGVELRTLCRSGTHTVNELTPPPKPSVLISGAAKKNFVILREKRQFTFCPCSFWSPGWLDGYQLILMMIILTCSSQNHTHLWTISQTYPRWCLIKFCSASCDTILHISGYNNPTPRLCSSFCPSDKVFS